MLRYVIRRVLYSVPILLGVLLVTYFLFFGTASPETIARRNLSSRNPSRTQITTWLTDHGYGEPSEADMKKDGFGRALLSAGLHPKKMGDAATYTPSDRKSVV